MFNHLYRQEVVLKKVNGTDSYGKHIVTETKTINCRLNFKNQIVKNGQGVDSVTRATLKTAEPVDLNDIINFQGKDWPVVQASPVVDFDGAIQAYEVYF